MIERKWKPNAHSYMSIGWMTIGLILCVGGLAGHNWNAAMLGIGCFVVSGLNDITAVLISIRDQGYKNEP